MSIVAITGDHPRHAYFVRCLAETGLLVAWIRERREAFVPSAPAGLATPPAGCSTCTSPVGRRPRTPSSARPTCPASALTTPPRGS